jgi:transcriptional regulator with XRE-family HTH domain
MTESLGARLRHQRERQQITLRTIAERTKIKISLLEGLERDDVSRWPSGIFRRTYFRDYVRAIGLPADEMMREFLQIHPDPEDGLSSLSGVLSPGERGAAGESAPGRLRQALESVFGAISGSRSGEMRAPSVEGERRPAPDLQPAREVSTRPDLGQVAELCTRLARTDRLTSRTPLLTDIVGALGARGVIVWVREADGAKLRPALACGYRDDVLAHLAPVSVDEANATAVACRSAQLCAVNSRKQSNCALAVPLMTPAGCGGVLALEFACSDAPTDSHRALATIVAAQVARLIDQPGPDAREARIGPSETRSPLRSPDKAAASPFLEVTG